MTNQNYTALKKNIISQAKYYLEHAGEFFPFGAVLDYNHKVKPIGAYFESENPKSAEVVSRIENALKIGIEKKEYQLGAIGIDVFLTLEKFSEIEKKNALEIRIYENNYISKFYFLYFKKNNSYYFKEFSAI